MFITLELQQLTYKRIHSHTSTNGPAAYSKTCVKQSLSKRPQIGFRDQLSLNAGQKYCRMLQGHSAIVSTYIKLAFVIKIFVLSIFEWPLYIGFTLYYYIVTHAQSLILNANDDVLSRAWGLNFPLNLQLHSYCAYASRKCSGETAHRFLWLFHG